MEKILQTFKKIYQGDNIVKRHLIIPLLLLLPSMAVSFVSLIDKETPAMVSAVLVLCSIVTLILSFIPFVMLSGLGLDFCKSRLVDNNGIPAVDWSTFPKGLKALPLYIVWGIYYSILGLVFFSVPIACFIFGLSIMKENPLLFVGIIFLSLFLCFISAILAYMVSPFMCYIFINYSSDFKYKAELFNPLSLFSYMKKAFKDTIIVLFKYLLVNMVLNTAASLITTIFAVVLVGYIIFITIISPEGAVYTPLNIAILTILSSIMAVFQGYVMAVTGFAMTDNVVEIYKNEIAAS